MDDPPSKQIDPLLDPRTPPPAFSESPGIVRSCAPDSLATVRDELGNVMIDPIEFHRIMTFGREVAQARQVWNFEQRRLERQRDVVNGWARRISPADFERLRREEEEYQRWRGQIRAARDAGKTDSQTRQMLMNMSPKRPYTSAHSIPQNVDDLQYNRSVLEAQDEGIKQREASYGDRLVALYAASVKVFASIPSDNHTIEVLSRFDTARDSNLHGCMSRTGLTPTSTAANASINAQYVPLVRASVANTRGIAIASLRQTKSSKEFSDKFMSLYPTQLLRELAQEDTEFARAAEAYNKQLLAIEERAREEIRKRLAAEDARRLAEQIAEFRRRAANNVPPSIGDVTRLYTSRSMERTEKNYFRLERNSANSFGIFNLLFKIGDVTFSISNFTCTPKNGRQHCAFSSTPAFSEVVLMGMLGRTEHDGASKYGTADFYWTDAGLASDNLEGTEIFPEVSSSISKPPSQLDRIDEKNRARIERDDEFNRAWEERKREKANR